MWSEETSSSLRLFLGGLTWKMCCIYLSPELLAFVLVFIARSVGGYNVNDSSLEL